MPSRSGGTRGRSKRRGEQLQVDTTLGLTRSPSQPATAPKDSSSLGEVVTWYRGRATAFGATSSTGGLNEDAVGGNLAKTMLKMMLDFLERIYHTLFCFSLLLIFNNNNSLHEEQDEEG